MEAKVYHKPKTPLQMIRVSIRHLDWYAESTGTKISLTERIRILIIVIPLDASRNAGITDDALNISDIVVN